MRTINQTIEESEIFDVLRFFENHFHEKRTVIRSCIWQMSYSHFWNLFKQRVIYHRLVNTFPDFMITTPFIGQSEFVPTKANVQEPTCFNNNNEIHAFSHIIRHPS